MNSPVMYPLTQEMQIKCSFLSPDDLSLFPCMTYPQVVELQFFFIL